MSNYTISTGEGGELGTVQGSLSEARRSAQESANERGETVYLSGPGIDVDEDDDTDIGEAFAPTASKPTISISFRGHTYTAGFDGAGLASWLLEVVDSDARRVGVRDLVGDLLAEVPHRELSADEVLDLFERVKATVYAEA